MHRSEALRLGTAVKLGGVLLGLLFGLVLAPSGLGLVVPGQPRNLSRSPGLDGRPSGSPDGRMCAFASARGGPIGIYLLDLEGLAVKPLVLPQREGEFCDQPAWSPKGDLIAFASNMGGRVRPDIFVVRPDGKGLRPVVESPATDWMPSFSPDGREILFVSDRGGKSAIYRVGLEGGEPELVARDAWEPAWSPRGDLIAYTAVRGGRVGVYVAKPDGSGERLVAEGGREPCFSPDGRLLAYVVGSGGECALRVVPVGRAEGRVLFSAGVPLGSPDWPVGGILLFEATAEGDAEVWCLPLRREAPEARISFPREGEVLRGRVEVRGTVKAPQGMLREWRLSLLPLGRPEEAVLLSQGGEEVEEGLLAQWETGSMAGTYLLELSAEDIDGDVGTHRVKVHIFGAYGVEYLGAEIPSTMTAGRAHRVKVRLKNIGSMTWRAEGGYAVAVLYRWLDAKGRGVFQDVMAPLPEDVPMGGEVEVEGEVVAPSRPGSYTLEVDLVQGGRIVFSEQGCVPLRASVKVVVPYAARLVGHDLGGVLAPGQVYSARVRLENLGAETWEGVVLSYCWLDSYRREVEVKPFTAEIEGKVEPGEVAEVMLPVRAPAEVGKFTLVLRLLSSGGKVLVADAGRIEVDVRRPYAPSLRILWVPLRLEPGATARVEVEVRNEGALPLPASGPGRAGVWAVFLDRQSRKPVSEGVFTPLPSSIPPGGWKVVRAKVVVPREGGDYILKVEARKADGTWLGGEAEAAVSVARRALEVRWELVFFPSEMVVGQPGRLKVRLRNLGSMRWPSKGERAVRIRPRFLDLEGREVRSATPPTPLPFDLGCGEGAEVEVEVVAPHRPGRYMLELDLEQEGGVGLFSRLGCETLRVPVRVLPLYAVAFLSHDTPPVVVAGQSYTVRLRLRNEGALVWEPSGPGAVCLSYRVLDTSGGVVVPSGPTAVLPKEVRMGEEVEVRATFRAPDKPGRYVVVWDLLHGGEVWFSERGARALEVEVEVR